MRGVPLELTAFLFLLFAVPAHLVLPGFGAAGAPASLLGVMMLVLLAIGWVRSEGVHTSDVRRTRVNPIVVAVSCYFFVLLAFWVNGRLHALTSLASAKSDRSLLAVVSLVGVALFVIARVRTFHAAVRLVDGLLLGTAFMCGIGLVQFFLSRDLSTMLRLPGLASLRGSSGIGTRSIFNRPFGTALHPIEFGVVAAAMVPVAWWRARNGTRWHWVVLGAIALSAMTSLSRSAILTLAIGVLVLLIGSDARDRALIVAGGCAFVVAAGSAVPGLVGTLRSLFQQAENDPSVQARLDRTPEVLRLIAEYPWFGRGFGTFTPEEYLLLDNEIQKMAIEIGLVGVALFIGFITTILWCAAHVAPRLRDTPVDGLGLALSASILGIVVSFYTFDAFFYHILTSMLFVNIALVGVIWNLAHEPAGATPTERDSEHDAVIELAG